MYSVSHQFVTLSVKIYMFKSHCNYFKWKFKNSSGLIKKSRTLGGFIFSADKWALRASAYM